MTAAGDDCEDELTGVRRTLRASLTDLERRAAQIRRALEALEFDGAAHVPRSPAKRKQRRGGVYEAVRQLVATIEPHETFTAESLADRLKAQGFVSHAVDPVNAYRSVLSRLTRAGEIQRDSRGVYRQPDHYHRGMGLDEPDEERP